MWDWIKNAVNAVWETVAATLQGPGRIDDGRWTMDDVDVPPMPPVRPPRPDVFSYEDGFKQLADDTGLETAVIAGEAMVRRQWLKAGAVFRTLGPRVGLLHVALIEEGLTEGQRIAISRRVLHCRRLNRMEQNLESRTQELKNPRN